MNAFEYALCAAFIWGIVPILEKIGLSKIDPLVGLFYRSFGVILGGVILGAFFLKGDQIRNVDLKTVSILLLSGFLASFVAQIFFYNGLKVGEVSRIVPIAGSFPLITFVLGVLIFGESITLSKVVGLICIVAGVWFLK